MHEDIGRSLSTDYFRIADQLSTEELGYLLRTRAFVDDEVLPVINGYWERAEFPWPLIGKLAKLGIVGDGIEGYGCPPMSPIATGLVHMELNRGDGSLGTFLGVQAGLAMQSIAMLGSEEQKQRWLPGMARRVSVASRRQSRSPGRLQLGWASGRRYANQPVLAHARLMAAAVMPRADCGFGGGRFGPAHEGFWPVTVSGPSGSSAGPIFGAVYRPGRHPPGGRGSSSGGCALDLTALTSGYGRRRRRWRARGSRAAELLAWHHAAPMSWLRAWLPWWARSTSGCRG